MSVTLAVLGKKTLDALADGLKTTTGVGGPVDRKDEQRRGVGG